MRNRVMTVLCMLAIALVSYAVVATSAQRGPSPTAKAAFDPRDFSGIWTRVGCKDCGDNGFGLEVPPLTPEGQKRLDANKPSYGRALGSADAAAHPEEHIGRRRAIPPAQGNDPASQCSPNGVTRLILTTYFSYMEFIPLRDRILQRFEWTSDLRDIWMDGRKLPEEPDTPRWNGYSIGRWEGDTLVVNSSGFDERTWLDQFAYPHSDQMLLEERYRKVAPNRLELTMTITDAVVYTKPWVSQKKAFTLIPKSESTVSDWYGLFDNRCVPSDETEFNDKVRDPAGGIFRK